MAEKSHESRLVAIETNVAQYFALVQAHMVREEKEREEDRKMLNKLFELIREMKDHMDIGDEKIERKIREYVDDKYITKLEFEQSKVENAKVKWVASGISLGISLAVTLLGLFVMFGKLT